MSTLYRRKYDDSRRFSSFPEISSFALLIAEIPGSNSSFEDIEEERIVESRAPWSKCLLASDDEEEGRFEFRGTEKAAQTENRLVARINKALIPDKFPSITFETVV